MPEPQWFGTETLVEQAGSPQWDFGDTITATQVFKGPHALCLSSAPLKGTAGSGDFAGLLVSKATVVREKGGIGLLTITYEGWLISEGEGGQVPSDEVEIELIQQELAIEKHPKFSLIDTDGIRAAHAYVDAKEDKEITQFDWLFQYEDTTELVRRLQRGQDHYVMYVPVYVWTSYYITEPFVDPGGYPEDPFGPATAPLGFEWLRAGDTLSFTGAFWKLTRRWIAGLEVDGYIYPPSPP
jgi:hypothetical protein